MQYRYLGLQRLKVSAIGFGCPTFQGKLSDADEKRDIAVIHRAVELGVNFIDTADHNDGNNEELLAKALKGKRSQVVLTSKFGNLRGQPWPWAKERDVDGRPEYVTNACEASLRRLVFFTQVGQHFYRARQKAAAESVIGNKADAELFYG